MIVMSGKEVGVPLEAELAQQVAELRTAGVEPGLAVVMVGDNPESTAYVGGKLKAANRLGIRSIDRHLPATLTQAELDAELEHLNADPAVHGVLCQLPLPEHLDAARVAALVQPAKDVDCFHPLNYGLLARGTPRFLPCTPAGILAMLRHYSIDLSGQHAVVLGRSNIVGRPTALLLSHHGQDATVTLCHSRTRDLPAVTRQADLLVVAIGHPHWVGAEHVREGAVVIDVGIHRVPDETRPRGYRITGDVDYEAVAPRVAAITPVPGGVGPLTVLMLMRNTMHAARIAAGLAVDAPGTVK